MNGDEFRERLAELGISHRNLAKLLGIAGPTLSQWVRVPDRHVVRVANITGISKEELRPDIFYEEVGSTA